MTTPNPGQEYRITDQTYQHLLRKIDILKLKIDNRLAGNSPCEVETITRASEEVVNEKFHTKNENSTLKLVNRAEQVIRIGALEGKETIYKCKKSMFGYWLHKPFYVLDEPSYATPEVECDIYEIIKDATSYEVFSSLTKNLGDLVMTQAQIICFIRSYPQWVNRNLFLCSTGEGTMFVVTVYSHELLNKYEAILNFVHEDHIWESKKKYYLITPKFIP